MTKHKQTGAIGEQIAAKFLENKNYLILHQNWRYEKKEVDIIALDKEMLVFVEVKTRRDFSFGFPEEAVTVQKQNFLKTAADAFVEAHPQYNQLRFDIISIIVDAAIAKEIKHFEDAFF